MKRYFFLVSVFAMSMLISAACRPLEVPETPTVALPSETPSAVMPTETAMPTETLEPTETAMPTETPEPTATVIPTETPTPEVWEIWFKGFSCEQALDCNPQESTESQFYSIMSDGTGLRQLEITEFPPLMLALPDNAPPFTDKQFLMSPDNSRVLYRSELGALYSVNMVDGEATILYTPTQQEAVRAYCWTSDGLRIKFLTATYGSSAMFSVGRSGGELRQEINYQEIQYINAGVCSPDYQEMAVVSRIGDKSRAGLLIINMNNGESYKILAEFTIWDLRVAHEQ